MEPVVVVSNLFKQLGHTTLAYYREHYEDTDNTSQVQEEIINYMLAWLGKPVKCQKTHLLCCINHSDVVCGWSSSALTGSARPRRLILPQVMALATSSPPAWRDINRMHVQCFTLSQSRRMVLKFSK